VDRGTLVWATGYASEAASLDCLRRQRYLTAKLQPQRAYLFPRAHAHASVLNCVDPTRQRARENERILQMHNCHGPEVVGVTAPGVICDWIHGEGKAGAAMGGLREGQLSVRLEEVRSTESLELGSRRNDSEMIDYAAIRPLAFWRGEGRAVRL